MWEKTAWFIGGGAEHSAELARLILFAGTSGAEGVVTSDSCKVRALGTPGGGVRITPGAALIRNRSAGGTQQSYAARNAVEHTVSIPSTGASARSDLVIVRIEDPQYSPWAAPGDMTTATFVKTHVLSNVGAGVTSAEQLNLGYSAIALARIDIPANTGAITDAMIKDVRAMPQRRSERQVYPLLPGNTYQMTDSFNGSGFNVVGGIRVPSWATQAVVRGDCTGVLITGSQTDLEVRVNLGGTLSQSSTVTSEPSRRIGSFTAGLLTIPAAMRGTSGVEFNLQLRKRLASQGGVQVDSYSVGVLDIEFQETAV